MTKIVLSPDGYLYLSTKAVIELVRRGSAGIHAWDTTGVDEELMERIGGNIHQMNRPSDWLPIEGEPEYEVHFFYKDSIRKGFVHYRFDGRRDDPILVQLVEELGSEVVSEGHKTPLVVTIPDDVDWEIEQCTDCAPKEWISEKHRVWEVDLEGTGWYEDIRP